MIQRAISSSVLTDAGKYPVISLVGCRQSGKTTLAKMLFSEKRYTNLENPEDREYALSDPKSFLTQSSTGMIIDEAQTVPELFSYIQVISDEINKPGYYILTGSNNFSLMESISQSLAGRISNFTLLPFSKAEIDNTPLQMHSLPEHIIKGFFPRLHQEHIEPNGFYLNYVQTYLERDVRKIKNITNLSTFQRFITLCAGRVGQLLNISSLADDCDISFHTAASWLSLLETSYIIYLLKPYHKSFNKRLTKMPKLYFYDTGLLCTLLKVHNEDTLNTHPFKGNIFENFIISELTKWKYHGSRIYDLYFWRDNHGLEVDCILEIDHSRQIPIEIKSSSTIKSEHFKSIEKYNILSSQSPVHSHLIYGGEADQTRSICNVNSWRVVGTNIKTLFE